MYKVTATRITDTGYATGLTPTLRILNYDGSLLREVTMEEAGEGNYKYDFEDINTEKLYFFNMDAGTDNVIARLKATTNQVPDSTTLFRSVVRGNNTRQRDISPIIKKEIEELFEKYLSEKPIIQPIDNTDVLGTIASMIIEEVNKNKTTIDYNLIESIIDSKISKIVIPEVIIPKEDNTSMFDSLKETIKEGIDNIVSKVKPLEEAHTKREQKKQDKLLNAMIDQLAEDIILEDLLLKELTNGEYRS